jgi:hypothetical protein
VLKPTARVAALLASATLAAALLGGCSNDNVDCGLNSCTVSIDRQTDASVSVLGVEAKFVSADANTVTLDVAGEQIQLTKGQQAVQVAGLQVALNSISADSIGLQISR